MNYKEFLDGIHENHNEYTSQEYTRIKAIYDNDSTMEKPQAYALYNPPTGLLAKLLEDNDVLRRKNMMYHCKIQTLQNDVKYYKGKGERSMKAYQSKGGKIYLQNGNCYTPLTLTQVEDLHIDLYALDDFSHDLFLQAYGIEDNLKLIPKGMNFKKEWNEKEHKSVIKTFSEWEKKNLIITYGKIEKSIENTYGLPYESSGDFAMLCNTNVQAKLQVNQSFYFNWLALTEKNEIVAGFSDENECEKVIVIGEIKKDKMRK